jgi:hypothetical protein
MTRGPRTPQGFAAVTRSIRRVNALGLNRRGVPGKQDPDIVTILRQPETRVLAAQIVAMLEGEGHRSISPFEKVLVDLLAATLRAALLVQDQGLTTASRAFPPGSRSPGAQDTGKAASVRSASALESGDILAPLPGAPPERVDATEETS